MNHKGLVRFDRQTKKDSFFLYKAYWNPQPMIHIAGKRYAYRPEKVTTVKVYTNCDSVTLYADGQPVATKGGSKVLTFRVTLGENTNLEAVSGNVRDTATLHYTQKPLPQYKLRKGDGNGQNWTK